MMVDKILYLFENIAIFQILRGNCILHHTQFFYAIIIYNNIKHESLKNVVCSEIFNFS